MDANDASYMYNTLVIDENAKNEAILREKKRKENLQIDPFLKAFLSKKSHPNMNSTASNQSTKLSRNHFSGRNSS